MGAGGDPLRAVAAAAGARGPARLCARVLRVAGAAAAARAARHAAAARAAAARRRRAAQVRAPHSATSAEPLRAQA